MIKSCGVLIHNQVVQRSTHIFALPNSLASIPQAIFSPVLSSETNAPLIQAGAFFPDWGYQCLSADDDSEAAHWPPFLLTAVDYINSKYGFLNETANQARSQDEQQHLENLIAFVFALASHQTADATWHAVHLPTGLLAALTGVDFDGDWEHAHNTLDYGADFLAAARLGRLPDESSNWLQPMWSVPIDDLVEIYQRIGRRVSKLGLRYCCMRGLAALKAEVAFWGQSWYQLYMEKSPMLLDEVDGYYLGGVEEMSARTVGCWANLTRWFSEDIDESEKARGGWEVCDVFQAIGPRGERSLLFGKDGTESQWSNHNSRHSLLDKPEFRDRIAAEMAGIKVTTNRFGIETYTLSSLLDFKNSTLPVDTSEERSYADQLFEEDPVYISTYVPYGGFGSSISTGYFYSDPHEISFAIGSPWETEDSSRPGEGNVYIVPASYAIPPSDAQNIYLNGTTSIKSFGLSVRRHQRHGKASLSYGSPINQRFGTTSVGFRALNRVFLAVSAPEPLTYDSSQSSSSPLESLAPGGRVDLFLPGEATPTFTFSVKGAELGSIGNRQWGDAILSATLDADSNDEFLIVSGSRSDTRRTCEGQVKTQIGEGLVTILQLRQTALESHLNSGIFILQDSTSTLCVDQDTCYEIKSSSASSSVTANIWNLQLPSIEKSHSCTGTSAYERFGAATAFSPKSRILWVSAPGRGKVFGYLFRSSSESNSTFIQTIEISDPEFAKREKRTGFGYSLKTGTRPSGREWIAVSAPNEDIGDVRQAGVVRLYYLGHKLQPVLVAKVIPARVEAFAKFGRVLEEAGKGVGLLIGSERAKDERGVVWSISWNVLPFPFSSPYPYRPPSPSSPFQKILSARTDNEIAIVEAEILLQGKEVGARFGASLTTITYDDGRWALAVGIPWAGVSREKQNERFFGAVVVYVGKT